MRTMRGKVADRAGPRRKPCGSAARVLHSGAMADTATILDVQGLTCPLPVLKANKALRGMPPGARLTVLATDPAAVKDFAAFCRKPGTLLLASTEDAGVFRFVLRRRGRAVTEHACCSPTRACLQHEPGEYHPECPDRLRAVLRALEAGGFRRPRSAPRRRTPRAEQLSLAHPRDYVDAILGIRPGPGRARAARRRHHDEPRQRRSRAARGRRRRWRRWTRCAGGEARRAFCATRPPGHHAEPPRPMGFCLFANAVVAARHASAAHGVGRVAILDFDVHHGNGTQACVEDDPTLFYASSHQWPLLPRHRPPAGARASGNVCNAPCRPGADGAAFRAAWDDMLLPALERLRARICS